MVTAAGTHIDITAIKNGKAIRRVTTTFFPGTIPNSVQGNRGRSRFDVTLNALPADAQIEVAVHNEPKRLCTAGS